MSPRWALMISGRGSTAQAVMDLIGMVNVTLVISSRASAAGLFRARRAGVATMVLPKDIPWDDLSRQLQKRGIERIFLLGFMRILPEDFLSDWEGRIWNVHPSLLPKYPGAKALEAALAAGDDVGVSIHDVIPEMDAGRLRRQIHVATAAEYSTHEFSAVEQDLVREFARAQSLRGAVDAARSSGRADFWKAAPDMEVS